MVLTTLDWSILLLFFLLTLGIGVWASRSAGNSTADFFLSGRNMPWWLLGISMVATTFSADTPNLVTDIVRKNGIAGNWVWWAFLLTGMLTVFVYARLWRKSGVLTDLSFYELRYSGREAAFLRGFRALYLGVFFNVMIMAGVCLAGIKIGGVLLGISPMQTLFILCGITVVYSWMGGLTGVIFTDFFQFILAMGATFYAAYYIVQLPEIGTLSTLISHPNVVDKLHFVPHWNNREVFVTLFILPLAVQWWSVWYPGAEPGGGGYIAQRMLSAKNEKHAVAATLLFNVAHYALRPWPWIVIALASLIIFPDLHSLQMAFPDLDASIINDDMAYPAMMRFLPQGAIGLVVASLMAAFMSTISSHLNWGSSYVVHDFYQRFIRPDASEKELVALGRWTTLFLMVVAGLFALLLTNALQAFQILLQIGAGTGLLFIMRWFWYRINAYSELTAMAVSFLLAIYLQLLHPLLGFEPIRSSNQLLLGVGLTTFAWVAVTLFTSPSDANILQSFVDKINPGGPGWRRFEPSKGTISNEGWSVPQGLLCMLVGTFVVYCFLFGMGFVLLDQSGKGTIVLVFGFLGAIVLYRLAKKLKY